MVYVFFADGFEEVEALTPVDYMRRAGIDVVTLGVGNKYIRGAHNITIECDDIIENATGATELQGIVLPGGMPGTINLENSLVVQKYIDFCIENNKMVAAICAAPSILGHKNILIGKQAVCFPGFEKDLFGAEIVDSYSVTDGNIITAKGAGSAPEFAFDIIRYLVSDEKAEEIRKTVQTCY
ncbi:MAG: DJ-1/PfpI family protein [Clostridia bacterium]|nr:DJ-1/PfpI family protein [Clostridia bacterium]